MEKYTSSFRLDDMLEVAGDGRTAISGFMNPEEQYHTASYLKRDADNCFFVFFGGFGDAERKKLFVFPSYRKDSAEYVKNILTGSVAAVFIQGSGYVSLSHSSFLGAVLAPGIKREAIGDIIVRDGRDAIVFCDEKMAAFLLSGSCPIEYVGRDKVVIRPYIIPADFKADRLYKTVSDTIASARLDSVVAALTCLSREKAKAVIKSGAVFLNYIENIDCDSAVCDGDICSVRGFGKFKIADIHTKTRKDKICLMALKYI